VKWPRSARGRVIRRGVLDIGGVDEFGLGTGGILAISRESDGEGMSGIQQALRLEHHRAAAGDIAQGLAASSGVVRHGHLDGWRPRGPSRSKWTREVVRVGFGHPLRRGPGVGEPSFRRIRYQQKPCPRRSFAMGANRKAIRPSSRRRHGGRTSSDGDIAVASEPARAFGSGLDEGT